MVGLQGQAGGIPPATPSSPHSPFRATLPMGDGCWCVNGRVCLCVCLHKGGVRVCMHPLAYLGRDVGLQAPHGSGVYYVHTCAH